MGRKRESKIPLTRNHLRGVSRWHREIAKENFLDHAGRWLGYLLMACIVWFVSVHIIPAGRLTPQEQAERGVQPMFPLKLEAGDMGQLSKEELSRLKSSMDR